MKGIWESTSILYKSEIYLWQEGMDIIVAVLGEIGGFWI